MDTKIIEEVDCYDGEPLIHIREDKQGRKYWCHCVGFDNKCAKYLMVPVTDDDIRALKANEMDLCEVFYRPERYLLNWSEDITIDSSFTPDPTSIPKPGVRLRPTHELN